MLYEEAKVLFSEGLAIRRKSWQKDAFVNAQGASFPSSSGDGNGWTPTNEDANAQDWEEYPQAKVLKYQNKVLKDQMKQQKMDAKAQKILDKQAKQLEKDQKKLEKDKARLEKEERRRLKAGVNNAINQ